MSRYRIVELREFRSPFVNYQPQKRVMGFIWCPLTHDRERIATVEHARAIIREHVDFHGWRVVEVIKAKKPEPNS